MPMSKKNKSRGQALVEFALAATLIFFLLAAAVDLGFMFFAVQGLHNAAQEGGTYGSRWLTSNLTTGARELNANTIRDNVRHESGSRGGIGFRSEEHTSELQSRRDLVCRLLLEKKKRNNARSRSRTKQTTRVIKT